MFKNYIEDFCKSNEEKYSYMENYFEHSRSSKGDPAISVKQGFSYMDMLMELTQFLSEKDYDDENFCLEGISIAEKDTNTIVYFPNYRDSFMTLDKAFGILERYYVTIYDYSGESNFESFDSDVALTKQKLEDIVDKRQVDAADIDFLKSLLETEDLGESVEEAILYIIEG